MKPRIIALLFIAFFTFAQSQEPAKTIFTERKWTSADGLNSFVGTLTKLQSGKVTILKEGTTITFSVKKLSEADREFLGQGVTFTTLDGKTFENAYVSQISASSVTLMTPSGIVTVEMGQLPENMRNRLGYDPDAVDLGKAERRDCYVYRFVDDGIIFHTHGYHDSDGNRAMKVTSNTGAGLNQLLEARLRDNQYHLKGIPESPVLVDNHIFSAFMIPDGFYEFGGSRIKSFKFLKWGAVLDMDKSMGSRKVIFLPASP